MIKGSERILTTQLGSLPRSEALLAMLMKIEKGVEVDRGEFRRQVEDDMLEVISRQAEAGIDIVGDGELPPRGRLGEDCHDSAWASAFRWKLSCNRITKPTPRYSIGPKSCL